MKILIIGIVASGKTTLAKRLSEENDIKYYEIDSIVHDDVKGRKRTDKQQQDIIKEIDNNDNWIIEGVLRKNLYNLLNKANKIIYLDIPLKKRKRRILKRYIKQKLKLEKCNYKPNIKMLKKMYNWTENFEKSKAEFEEMLSGYSSKLDILRSEKEIKNYKIDEIGLWL